jgi:hypothetical protein
MATPSANDVAVETAKFDSTPASRSNVPRKNVTVPPGRFLTGPFYLSREQLLGRRTATVQPTSDRISSPR